MYLGMVNFYQDMFLERSYFLVSFNKLASKKGKDWYWGPTEQKELELAKKMLTEHAILTFLNFEKPFDLYTEASDR